MSKKYKIAILGGGCNSAVGYAHISSLRLSSRFDIIAGYFSRDKNENIRSHAKYDLPWINHKNDEVSWIREVRDHCDLILILTPSDKHFDHLKLCIDHDINAISEKPICCSKEEASQLQELLKS